MCEEEDSCGVFFNAALPISELPFSTRPRDHNQPTNLSCQLLCGSKQYACTRRAPCTAGNVGKGSGSTLRVRAWTLQANTHMRRRIHAYVCAWTRQANVQRGTAFGC